MSAYVCCHIATVITKLTLSQIEKKAIGLAIHYAKPGDIVAILGKGHETYQEIQGVRYDFDDVAVVGEMIKLEK